MATYGQISYLNSLMKNKMVPSQFVGMDINPLSTPEASELIKILLAQPDAVKSASTTKAKKDYAPEGFYSFEGEVYRVVTSAYGTRYAKKLVAKSGKGTWEYSPDITPLLDISHLVSLEEAKQFGKIYGFCMVCGRTLTDPESVANGIGPICADNFKY